MDKNENLLLAWAMPKTVTRLASKHHPDFALRTKSVPPETGGKKCPMSPMTDDP